MIPSRTTDLRGEAGMDRGWDRLCMRRTRCRIGVGSRRRSILRACAGALVPRMGLETGAAMTRVQLLGVDREEGGRMDWALLVLCYSIWTAVYGHSGVAWSSVKGLVLATAN